MNTERKILANLAWRVYTARHKRNEFARHYFGTPRDHLFYEAEHQWVGLHNAFNQAKQIYFDNQPKD